MTEGIIAGSVMRVAAAPFTWRHRMSESRVFAVPMFCLAVLMTLAACRTTQSGDESQTAAATDRRVDDDYCVEKSSAPRATPDDQAPRGYAIFSLVLRNFPGYLEYFGIASQLLAKQQAKPITRGIVLADTLEGQAFGQSFSVVEFPSMKKLDDFYCAPDYQPEVRKIRLNAGKLIFSVVKEGDVASISADTNSVKGSVKAFAYFNDVVTDQAAYGRYLEAATILAKASGGTRLFSGSDHIEIEGYAQDKPDNLTLFVFPSMAKLREWYDSPAYQALKAERLRASQIKYVIAADGYVP
jgi:uncharacterized protein (DUF1330 family)